MEVTENTVSQHKIRGPQVFFIRSSEVWSCELVDKEDEVRVHINSSRLSLRWVSVAKVFLLFMLHAAAVLTHFVHF